ncbi:hypothetical protein JN535_04155 [Cellulosimicrobium cellulans]|uniref:hypothetical protein n=1 Tax=Cellulosimicrobium cellulans TaxID=1710 RepID=UPI00196695C6|nr:hypothetical protein [Cellulosimicrobium cellulans]MBN0039367.1 hypothetical protein [Cellulosimicrobium cellulans]
MTALEVLVGRASVRCALAAVLPHVGGTETTSRVRFTFESGTRLLVSATDGSTLAVARAHVTGVVALPELAVVDVEPRSVREVLAVFTPPSGKDDRAMWNEESFGLTVTEDEVSWVERSEILDGRSLTVPRLPDLGDDRSYPDVPHHLTRFLQAPLSARPDATAAPKLLARFVTSAKAWGDDLQLDLAYRSGPSGFTVQVGDDFAGVLLPIHRDEERNEFVARYRDDWITTLTPLARPEETR